ncbi:hypothetical protein [Streptomyces sp.]|uniref:hypothetical protein n=1 Tax=Streptomyces sp. TaxID=1931 RepID=UPI0028123DAD|nr:hypothetical protein [Streptomyces sp.]
MIDSDDHVQHTWALTRGTDEITVDLWTDGYTVRVDGGPDDGLDDDRGRSFVEDELLPRYTAAGYRLQQDYQVNDPAQHADAVEVDDPEPDGRPSQCPECGGPVAYEPRFSDDFREGAAWLCTGCKWGRWITA